MTVLEVDGITRSFGKLTAVDDVSFDVGVGSIVGFIGPNGAGKTTTMRICATLDLPDKGDVRVHGSSVLTRPREARRAMGFMPDSYGAYANTSVLDYLDFYARAYGLRGEVRRTTIDEVIDFTGLAPLVSKPMNALSKGMRQRLCLAKTMLHDPSVFILDEPAAGLDPRARVELRELLKALAEAGKGVLISSHILTELSEMCDSVVVIESGHVRAKGTVAEVTRGIVPHVGVLVRALGERAELERVLATAPGVIDQRRDRDGVVAVVEPAVAAVLEAEGELPRTPEGTDPPGVDPFEEQLAELLEFLLANGVRPIEFSPEKLDLEDVFLSVTEGLLQ